MPATVLVFDPALVVVTVTTFVVKNGLEKYPPLLLIGTRTVLAHFKIIRHQLATARADNRR